MRLSFAGATGPVNEDVGIFGNMLEVAMINYESDGMGTNISCGRSEPDPASRVHWAESADYVLAPGYTDESYVNIPCDYLIITHNDFWHNQNLQNLALHRASYNGYNVVIANLNDIRAHVNPGTGNIEDEHRMRNFIKHMYNNAYAPGTYDSKLGFVLMFGDHNYGITNDDEGGDYLRTFEYFDNWGLPIEYDRAEDVRFAMLTKSTDDGYDLYPDVLIGRIPVDTYEYTDEDGNIVDEAYNAVTKIINYEPRASTSG